MRSFAQTLALAGFLALHAQAFSAPVPVTLTDPIVNCVANSDSVDAFCSLESSQRISDAMVNYAENYAWTLEQVTNDEGYVLSMIRIVGDENGDILIDRDENGDPVLDGAFTTELQWQRPALLITHTATKDCVDWLSASADGEPSIPFRLFQSGYDVFIGCRRGTQYSRTNANDDLDTADGQKDFFNYNTQTVGVEDVSAMAAKAVTVHAPAEVNSGANDCPSMQILTHGLGAAEALSALSGNPTV